MTRKTIGLSEELHAYALAHSQATDDVLDELAEETARRFPEHTSMQVAPEQGALFGLLVRLLDVRFAVEIGTFTGYSSLCIARGLPAGGPVKCGPWAAGPKGRAEAPHRSKDP